MRQKDVILINFFIARVCKKASFNARRSISSVFTFSLANFRRLSSFLLPSRLTKTQKLAKVGHVGQKRSSAAKKKEATFSSTPHKEQKTSSVSKQNAVAHVYQSHGTFIAFLFSFARMWFQSADFAFAFGLPVAVLSRVILRANFFFD
jgi:uncharacterized membrane protein